MIDKLLNRYSKLNMSVIPTPIQKLQRLSDILGCNIYCMRDDLTGFAFGGNKTRKLDYLIADALQKHCDSIIATGANQSNFCRMAAGAAVANGMEAHLILTGSKPVQPTGNLLIDHLLKANIHHIDSDKSEAIAQKATNLESELTKQGKKVYNMPLGGSTEIGALGYVEAFKEIVEYENQTGIRFSTIIHASGSGGTQAGLVAGKSLQKAATQIIGISVGRSASELSGIVTELANRVTRKVAYSASSDSVLVDDSFIGDGYGVKTHGGEAAISLFATNEGIILDYVYSGKAAAALISYCRSGKFNKNENVLFIHTGGNIELFE